MLSWLRKTLLSTFSVRAGLRSARFVRAKYDSAMTSDHNRRHWAHADGLSANAANSAGSSVACTVPGLCSPPSAAHEASRSSTTAVTAACQLHRRGRGRSSLLTGAMATAQLAPPRLRRR